MSTSAPAHTSVGRRRASLGGDPWRAPSSVSSFSRKPSGAALPSRWDPDTEIKRNDEPTKPVKTWRQSAAASPPSPALVAAAPADGEVKKKKVKKAKKDAASPSEPVEKKKKKALPSSKAVVSSPTTSLSTVPVIRTPSAAAAHREAAYHRVGSSSQNPRPTSALSSSNDHTSAVQHAYQPFSHHDHDINDDDGDSFAVSSPTSSCSSSCGGGQISPALPPPTCATPLSAFTVSRGTSPAAAASVSAVSVSLEKLKSAHSNNADPLTCDDVVMGAMAADEASKKSTKENQVEPGLTPKSGLSTPKRQLRKSASTSRASSPCPSSTAAATHATTPTATAAAASPSPNSKTAAPLSRLSSNSPDLRNGTADASAAAAAAHAMADYDEDPDDARAAVIAALAKDLMRDHSYLSSATNGASASWRLRDDDSRGSSEVTPSHGCNGCLSQDSVGVLSGNGVTPMATSSQRSSMVPEERTVSAMPSKAEEPPKQQRTASATRKASTALSVEAPEPEGRRVNRTTDAKPLTKSKGSKAAAKTDVAPLPSSSTTTPPATATTATTTAAPPPPPTTTESPEVSVPRSSSAVSKSSRTSSRVAEATSSAALAAPSNASPAPSTTASATVTPSPSRARARLALKSNNETPTPSPQPQTQRTSASLAGAQPAKKTQRQPTPSAQQEETPSSRADPTPSSPALRHIASPTSSIAGAAASSPARFSRTTSLADASPTDSSIARRRAGRAAAAAAPAATTTALPASPATSSINSSFTYSLRRASHADPASLRNAESKTIPGSLSPARARRDSTGTTGGMSSTARRSTTAAKNITSPTTAAAPAPERPLLPMERMDRCIYEAVMVIPPSRNEKEEMPPVMERPLSYYEQGMYNRHKTNTAAHYKKALQREQRALLRNMAWLPMTTVMDQRSGGVGALMMDDLRHMARVIRYAQELENWKVALKERSRHEVRCSELLRTAASSARCNSSIGGSRIAAAGASTGFSDSFDPLSLSRSNDRYHAIGTYHADDADARELSVAAAALDGPGMKQCAASPQKRAKSPTPHRPAGTTSSSASQHQPHQHVSSSGELRRSAPHNPDFSESDVDDDDVVLRDGEEKDKAATVAAVNTAPATQGTPATSAAASPKKTSTAAVAPATTPSAAPPATAKAAAAAPKKAAAQQQPHRSSDKDKDKQKKKAKEEASFFDWLADAFGVSKKDKKAKKDEKEKSKSAAKPAAKPTDKSARPSTAAPKKVETKPTTSPATATATAAGSSATKPSTAAAPAPDKAATTKPTPAAADSAVAQNKPITTAEAPAQATTTTAPAAPATGETDARSQPNPSPSPRPLMAVVAVPVLSVAHNGVDASAPPTTAVSAASTPGRYNSGGEAPLPASAHNSSYGGGGGSYVVRGGRGSLSVELPPAPVPVFRLYYFHSMEVIQELKRMTLWAATHHFVVFRVLTGTSATAAALAAAAAAGEEEEDENTCSVSRRRQHRVAVAEGAAGSGSNGRAGQSVPHKRSASGSVSGGSFATAPSAQSHHERRFSATFNSLDADSYSMDSRSSSAESREQSPPPPSPPVCMDSEAVYYNTVLLNIRIDRWLMRRVVLTAKDAATGMVQLELTELAESEAALAAQMNEEEWELPEAPTVRQAAEMKEKQTTSALTYFFSASTRTPR